MNVMAFEQLQQPPVFIVGAARSGTTWVHDIFNAHPQVAAIYESWLFTKQDGFGSLFSPAHFPTQRSGLGNMMDREALTALVRGWAMEIMAHAIEPGHRFLVEKSPSHLYAIPLIREVFPEARFIHVLRDGRDVAVSVLKAARSWQQSWRQSFGQSVRTSAGAWRNAVRRARREAQDLGSRFMEIRYEVMKSDPISAYRQLFDFCEIPYDASLLGCIYDQTDFKRNYKPGDSKFRRSGRIGDWRMEFGLRDALVFNLVAGELLVELGYERNRWWMPQMF